MAIGLLIGGTMQSADAKWIYKAPLKLIHGSETIQLVDASQTYGIRPAKNADSLPSSSPDTATGQDDVSVDKSSQIQRENGIRYVSGGVGVSERTELDALADQFNLHLLFATQGSGEYLSAVQVRILDARSQQILSTESQGPRFLAQLPPGDYRLEVTPTGPTGRDQTLRRTLQINESGQSRFDFYWRKEQ